MAPDAFLLPEEHEWIAAAVMNSDIRVSLMREIDDLKVMIFY